MNASQKSFWSLINKYTIVVPKIQRDYAQGRDEVAALRRRFLKKLEAALADPLSHAVRLDFVYGERIEKKFFPLDGQQRLTTLWLMHWYVAARAGILRGRHAGETQEVLSKFIYETRETSEAFCKALALFPTVNDWDGSDARKLISAQKFYLDQYDFDPTIRGMLTTLNDLFKDCRTVDFVKYWTMLTGLDFNCPITFYVKEMEENENDDLYVKMNARGKKLTEFENFKADWMGYELKEGNGIETEKLMTADDAALVDNDWTDLFWAHQANHEVDGIYFAFLRMYMLNWYVVESVQGGCLPLQTAEAIVGTDLFQHLYNWCEYDGIEKYAPVMNRRLVEELKRFFVGYASAKKIWGEENIDSICLPYWNDSDITLSSFTIIPRYSLLDNRGLFNARLKERVAFFAACKFFELNSDALMRLAEIDNNDAEKQKNRDIEIAFREWMHFVWNIIQNSFFDTDRAMVGALWFFKEASAHCLEIEKYLINDEQGFESNFAKEVVDQEKKKAKLRHYSRNNDEVPDWTGKILSAECTAFFKGGISFLLPQKEYESYLQGGMSDIFDLRLRNAAKYFSPSGSVLVEKYKIPFIKALIRRIGSWESLYDNRSLLDVSLKSWVESLLRKDEVICEAIRDVLELADLAEVVDKPFSDVVGSDGVSNTPQDSIRRTLLTSGVLAEPGVIREKSKWRLYHYYNDSMYFYPAYSSNCYCIDVTGMDNVRDSLRNQFLFNLLERGLTLKSSFSAKCRMCTTPDACFEFGGHSYVWKRNNIIVRDGNETDRLEWNVNVSEEKFYDWLMDKESHFTAGEE